MRMNIRIAVFLIGYDSVWAYYAACVNGRLSVAGRVPRAAVDCEGLPLPRNEIVLLS